MGLSINPSGVSLWSMASSSCGVPREKGLFGGCFDKCTDTLCLFPEKLHQFWIIFVCNFFVNFVLISSTLIRAGIAVQGPLVYIYDWRIRPGINFHFFRRISVLSNAWSVQLDTSFKPTLSTMKMTVTVLNGRVRTVRPQYQLQSYQGNQVWTI